MSKFIVRNSTTNLSDADAFKLVGGVVSDGKISNSGKNYCYVSVFGSREFCKTFNIPAENEIVVYAGKNDKSYWFNVLERVKGE